ncbi:Carboxypeptidase S [Tolypocladium ophioglossoides CBS 100239]|uniref:Carboxypeptidase S n=1 Tax=Tolypocladium ophioglossoides (strain CBS 100239) TaxID=1163406 RepID=A0A0L0N2R9_TOLOC|nr:Carboxypeptidase S [Tolypocladium ophioglossoides CBS 100239]
MEKCQIELGLDRVAQPARASKRPLRQRSPWLLCLLCMSGLVLYQLPLHSSPSLQQGRSDDTWCRLPDVVAPQDDGLRISKHFMGSTALALQVERLSAAVQVPTESHDDGGRVDEDPRWAVFGDFHGVLERLFPLVYATSVRSSLSLCHADFNLAACRHAHFELRNVNRYGLLYTLRGTVPRLKPILFMAHQDVVPAGASSYWTHPPYAGHYDGSFLWGRGSADCKNVLVGVLSAVEDLLAQAAFAPRRTIVLAFGFDEETGGRQGAAALSSALVAEWGRDAFLLALDEGGMGVQSLGDDDDVLYAYPGVGEKGYHDVQLTLDVPGGHSSRPPPHTGIGIMADAIHALEALVYAPRLPQTSPFRRVLECRARYSPAKVQPWLRRALLHAGEHEIAQRLADEASDEQWLMQTSQAVDVIAGGIKVNALPETVRVMINYRVALHESVAYVNQRIGDALDPIARKHDLDLRGFAAPDSNSAGGNTTARRGGVLTIKSMQTLDPAPLSPTDDSGVWAVFSGTVRHVFETAESGRGKTVVPVGNIMTGNTDTTHYWAATKNIYRYTPSRDGTRLNTHAIDERMEMTAHLEGVRFYYDLIRNFDQWDEE